MHNRKWSYKVNDAITFVTADVKFDAQCTFVIREKETTRVLKIVDDLGNIHGELDVKVTAYQPKIETKACSISTQFATKKFRYPDEQKRSTSNSVAKSI